MGLKNYHEQKANLLKIDNVINDLVQYARMIDVNYITIVQDHVVWGNNEDRYQVICGMQRCYKKTAQIEESCIGLKSEALYSLNQMDKLEKIIHGKRTVQQKQLGNGMVLEKAEVTTKANKIFIDLDFFDGGGGFCSAFEKQKRTLTKLKKDINSIERNIDPELKKSIKGKSGTFSKIRKDIDKLYEYNDSLVNMFRNVLEVYKNAEEQLLAELERYSVSVNSSGQVQGTIASQQYEKYQQGQEPIKWVRARSYVLEDPALYPKQGAKQCTLYANIYMMSRYSLLHGGEAITPNNYKIYTQKEVWTGNGMAWDYDLSINAQTGKVHVKQYKNEEYHGKAYSSLKEPNQKTEYIKNLLLTHPEGIVVYDHNSGTRNGMHAILVVDYDESRHEFLVIDPAQPNGKAGIIYESEALVKVENTESIWVMEHD